VHDVLETVGQPLDAETRARFEPRFGHDFSHVRVHTDIDASRSAQALDAHAYTVGSDIVFGAEQYQPRTASGAQLLAHELAHVAQHQTGAAPAARHKELSIAGVNDPLEHDADRAANLVMQSAPRASSLAPLSAAREPQVHRQQKAPVRVPVLPPEPVVPPEPVPPSAARPLAALGPLAAFLIVLFWPSEIAQDPPLPDPEPEPDPKKRRKPDCVGGWGPPQGGDSVHDDYARLVAEKYGHPALASLNFYMAGDGAVADFDHYNPESNEFFEAKTRHEILLRDYARSQPEVMARLYAQAEAQFEVMIRCAPAYPPPRLIWFFDDPEVAQEAQRLFGGVVDEVRHEPWPEGRPIRPRRRRRPNQRRR
jgi:hypothetical protein